MSSQSQWPSGYRVHLICRRFPIQISASYLCYIHVGNVTDCHAGHQEVSRYHTRGELAESIECRQESIQVRDPPWLWNPGQRSPEVQNSGISNSTKRTFVVQKHFKKLQRNKPNGKISNRGTAEIISINLRKIEKLLCSVSISAYLLTRYWPINFLIYWNNSHYDIN